MNFFKCWNRWYIFIWYRLWTGRSKVWFPAGVRDFSSPKYPNRLWGTPRLKFEWVFFARGYNGGVVSLTTSLHLVPRLRMSGAVPSLPLYAFMVCKGTAMHLLYAAPTFVTSILRTSEMGRWFVMFRDLKWTRSEVINLFNVLQIIRARSLLKRVKEYLQTHGDCLCSQAMLLLLWILPKLCAAVSVTLWQLMQDWRHDRLRKQKTGLAKQAVKWEKVNNWIPVFPPTYFLNVLVRERL
jgi:hypothetical protein